MELKGSVTIPASPDAVWQALNSPEVLRLCIPGCEEVRLISPTEMHARVMLRLGPVRANFVGKVLLTDVRPLLGCTLNFEGSGGSAGFARGQSVIVLSAVATGTQLDYTTQASVAGKLGQVGGRLMDASARQMADRFFAAFKVHVSGDGMAAMAGETPIETPGATPAPMPEATRGATTQAAASHAPATPVPPPTASGPFQQELSRLVWFAAGAAATAFGVWMGSHW